jgi:hypothetical protein
MSLIGMTVPEWILTVNITRIIMNAPPTEMTGQTKDTRRTPHAVFVVVEVLELLTLLAQMSLIGMTVPEWILTVNITRMVMNAPPTEMTGQTKDTRRIRHAVFVVVELHIMFTRFRIIGSC